MLVVRLGSIANPLAGTEIYGGHDITPCSTTSNSTLCGIRGKSCPERVQKRRSQLLEIGVQWPPAGAYEVPRLREDRAERKSPDYRPRATRRQHGDIEERYVQILQHVGHDVGHILIHSGT